MNIYERSEFRIATSKKKKLTVCLSGCSANLGFSVKSANRTRPKHGIPLLSKYTVFENTHTHIPTAASETEGVAAVSCMESHMIRRPLGLQPVQQYKHHVVRSIARSGVSPPGARRDGHHWCQAARTAQLARDLEVERAVMGQRCRPQSFGEVQRCLYSSSSTSNDRTEEMGPFFVADRFLNPKTAD